MSGPPAHQRATATDVARASNVSRATVSYVLNNTTGQTIPKETRDRVLAAAERLGYVPNASAQILAGGQSRFVIVASGDLPLGDLVGAYEQSALEDLRRHGFIPVVDRTISHRDAGPLLPLAASLRPTAIVASAPFDKDVSAQLRIHGDPRLVTTFPSVAALLRPIEATGAAQIGFLVERGHRAIGLARDSAAPIADFVEARARGASAAAERLGIDLHDALVWSGDLDAFVRQLDNLLRARPEITAIAAYNDRVAMAVLAAARALSVPVPARLAILGADNLDLASLVAPTLSSARYDFDTRSSATLGELLASGGPAPAAPHITISIIARESA